MGGWMDGWIDRWKIYVTSFASLDVDFDGGVGTFQVHISANMRGLSNKVPNEALEQENI